MAMAAAVAASSCTDATWWAYALPALLGADTLCAHPVLFVASLLLACVSAAVLAWAVSPGGPAWAHGRGSRGETPISGPCGMPALGSIFVLSRGLPHRALAAMARASAPRATELMAFSVGDTAAFSVGDTAAVVSSCPAMAHELLGLGNGCGDDG